MRIGKLFVLPIFVLIGSCFTKNSSIPEHTESRKKTLDAIGDHVMKEGQVLGFSVSIDSAGTTIYNGNFGHIDAEKTKPVAKYTRFDIASISKMIGVSVIMKLVEQEKLKLDQTLEELLPDFPNKPLARKITLRQMISHTSGLMDNSLELDSLVRATGMVPGKMDFYTFMPGRELLYQPGTHYQYSNPGFVLMAFIAEHATQKSWQELINEIINEPSDLDFQLLKYAVDFPETSPLFNFKEDRFEQIPTWDYVLGDGGLTATSEMLSKFPRLLANERIVSKASFKEMMNPRSLKDGINTGYGLGVRNGYFLGEQIIGHTGGWESTYAIMAYLPELDLTFTGLMNTDNIPKDIYPIFSQFMLAFLDKPFPDYSRTSMQFKSPELLVGEYHGFGDEFDDIGTMVEIKLADNGELLYCIENWCDRLYYMGSNRFWLQPYPFDYIEFQVGEQSQALREYYHGFFQVLRKKKE